MRILFSLLLGLFSIAVMAHAETSSPKIANIEVARLQHNLAEQTKSTHQSFQKASTKITDNQDKIIQLERKIRLLKVQRPLTLIWLSSYQLPDQSIVAVVSMNGRIKTIKAHRKLMPLVTVNTLTSKNLIIKIHQNLIPLTPGDNIRLQIS